MYSQEINKYSRINNNTNSLYLHAVHCVRLCQICSLFLLVAPSLSKQVSTIAKHSCWCTNEEIQVDHKETDTQSIYKCLLHIQMMLGEVVSEVRFGQVHAPALEINKVRRCGLRWP